MADSMNHEPVGTVEAVLTDDEDMDVEARATVAQVEDGEEKSEVESQSEDEIEPADINDITAYSDDAGEQMGNTEVISTDLGTDFIAQDVPVLPNDFSETLSDIVDAAVDSFISGADMDTILEGITDVLIGIYSEAVDNEADMGSISEIIADCVHELASVFDSPELAADSILSVIPDEEMADAIRDRIEGVHADMTADSYGTFGEISFDSDGLLIGAEDVNLPGSDMEATGFDVDSTITDLGSHMEAVSMEPEFQNLVTGEEWSQDMEAEKEKDHFNELDTGMESSEMDFPSVDDVDAYYDPIE